MNVCGHPGVLLFVITVIILILTSQCQRAAAMLNSFSLPFRGGRGQNIQTFTC